MRRYSTLLLDADDTLLDFSLAEKNAFFATMEELNFAADAATYHRYSTINDEEWKRLERGETTKPRLTVDRFRRFLSEFAIPADPVEVNRLYIANLSLGKELIPGAFEFLTAAEKNFDLYLITNGTAAVQEKRLAASDIKKFLKRYLFRKQSAMPNPNRNTLLMF